MIARASIDKVFETARVEEVIGDFVQLKKSGSNFKGLSPFTDERSPSFMVSPVKQIWKDFSSGKGGNVVAFLMEHEHFTYPEAIKYLAKKYNIEIEETLPSPEEKEAAGERESLYLVSEYAQKYFAKTLWQDEEGKAIGLSYFKERGFTDETIRNFGLGYSPDSWDAFTKQALADGYLLDFLDKTGLSIVKETKSFDRFKGRVMFPIHSMSGRVLGFGGRILTNDKKAAKYLNSPESDIYHKSKVLYGLYYAKQSIAKENNCYLVEGYTDVIQLHQRGVHNVVASSGTALTPDQIRLIRRLTNNITVLFDGDAAGLRASLRGIDLILEENMNVKVCSFPEGEDPDSFARSHEYEEIVSFLEDNAKDFIQFKAELLAKDAKNDPIKKAECVRDMIESISKIPDKISQEIYVKECSKIMDISEEALFSSLYQLSKGKIRQANKQEKQQRAAAGLTAVQSPKEKVNQLHELETDIIRALLLYGDKETEFEDLILKQNDQNQLELVAEKYSCKVFEKIFLDLQQDEIDFSHPDFKKLYHLLMPNFQSDEAIDLKNLSHVLDKSANEIVSDILMNEEQYQLHNWERKNIFVKVKEKTIAQFVSEIILNLRSYLIEQKKVELMQQITSKTESHTEILEEINNYNKLKVLLGRKLERVI
ncbi:MAG: DNA primase [Flavobacteriaceae bacterium]|nr:DNA primase [Flavobacteriaceae bacterium]